MGHAELAYEHVVGDDGQGLGPVVQQEGMDGLTFHPKSLHTVSTVAHVIECS